MTDPTGAHVLVAGVTTRALAVSAAHAGYRVTAVDAFGDLDLRAAAEVLPLRPERSGGYTAQAAVAEARAVPASLAAYTSNFENYPDAVARLMEGRLLLGNPPAVLARVRDPILLGRVLRRRGFLTPGVRATPTTSKGGLGSWLLKPRRSGGGHGITVWRRGNPVPRTSYLQERMVGLPGSVVFAADGRRAVPLGLTRQLVGDARFGARGFRYCGSLLGMSGNRLFPREQLLFRAATALATAVTEEFGLVGLNGLDFIARGGVPYPVEVNPRFSASMELIERAHQVSMFQVHVRACQGVLPAAPSPAARIEGKAIVFARRDVTLGDTRSWMEDKSLADVPHPGEQIRRGHPICTVFARANDPLTCHRLLTRRAARVYRVTRSQRQGAA